MDLRDYCGQRWNTQRSLLDSFKNLLLKWRNNKQELKKIYRPSDDISLFLNAVEHDADFVAYLIQFATKNDVYSSFLLDPVDGKNPLHAAIKKRDYQLVEKILKYAADQRNYASISHQFLVSSKYTTIFELAIEMKDIRSMNAIFRFVVGRWGSVVNADTLLGLEMYNRQSALHYAIQCGASHEVMRAIVTLAKDNEVDVGRLFRTDVRGKSALHFASCKSSKMVESVIELAKEFGICTKSLTCPDESGNSPLHYAAMKGDGHCYAILNFAKYSGIDVAGLFQPNCDERTPLHCAAINRYHKIFETVLWWAKNNGVPLHQMLKADSNGQTPLHLIAENHFPTTNAKGVQEILRIAHELNQLAALLKRDRFERTPLDCAAIEGNKVIAGAILQSVAQLDPEMVHVLLSSNASGKTALHFAAQEGNGEVALVIMQAAAESGREMVKTLLAPDECGRTPLLLALQSRSNGAGDVIMQFALKNGVDWRTLIDTKNANLRLKLKEMFYYQIILEPSIWPRLYPSESR